jgi:hypothetical protein
MDMTMQVDLMQVIGNVQATLLRAHLILQPYGWMY